MNCKFARVYDHMTQHVRLCYSSSTTSSNICCDLITTTTNATWNLLVAAIVVTWISLTRVSAICAFHAHAHVPAYAEGQQRRLLDWTREWIDVCSRVWCASCNGTWLDRMVEHNKFSVRCVDHSPFSSSFFVSKLWKNQIDRAPEPESCDQLCECEWMYAVWSHVTRMFGVCTVRHLFWIENYTSSSLPFNCKSYIRPLNIQTIVWIRTWIQILAKMTLNKSAKRMKEKPHWICRE